MSSPHFCTTACVADNRQRGPFPRLRQLNRLRAKAQSLTMSSTRAPWLSIHRQPLSPLEPRRRCRLCRRPPQRCQHHQHRQSPIGGPTSAKERFLHLQLLQLRRCLLTTGEIAVCRRQSRAVLQRRHQHKPDLLPRRHLLCSAEPLRLIQGVPFHQRGICPTPNILMRTRRSRNMRATMIRTLHLQRLTRMPSSPISASRASRIRHPSDLPSQRHLLLYHLLCRLLRHQGARHLFRASLPQRLGDLSMHHALLLHRRLRKLPGMAMMTMTRSTMPPHRPSPRCRTRPLHPPLRDRPKSRITQKQLHPTKRPLLNEEVHLPHRLPPCHPSGQTPDNPWTCSVKFREYVAPWT